MSENEEISKTVFLMNYVGGHLDYKPAIGYLVLKPDTIEYKTFEYSLNRIDLKVPIEKLKGLEIRTTEEITFGRWFLIGALSILFKAKKKYLILSYEDEADMLQHMFFDFNNQSKIEACIRLANQLKLERKQQLTK